MQSTFSKLGRVQPWTDYLIIGIETSRGKTDSRVDTIFETIDRFCISHLKVKNERLAEVDPMTEIEGHNILATILEYYNLGRNTLIVCNNSLVFLGSSDLTALLESGIYEIAQGTEDNADLGIEEKSKVSTQVFIASAPPTIVSLQSMATKAKVTIVDIVNYGIKRLGDLFLLINPTTVPEVPNYSDQGISIDKCDTVCAVMVILFRKLYNIVSKHKMGGIALTYAGQAMRCFRRNHYAGTIVKHAQEPVAAIEERCYVGGRCEQRFSGWYKGRCHLLDINSLYPSIGRTDLFPRELKHRYINPNLSTLSESIECSCWFAHLRVSTNEGIYPCQVDGRLCWPIGEFNTYLCGQELREALLRGDIIQIYYACEYYAGMVCKDYSEAMLKIRSLYKAKKDKVSEYLVKFITNGLWGKFGEQGNRWVLDQSVPATSRYGGFIRCDSRTNSKQHWRVIDGQCSKLCRSYWANNTFTPISAYVNSAARAMLWRYMQLCGLSNVLYCSIDGFIVTDKGKDNLASLIGKDQYDYGKFKIVESADECYIYSAGRYRIGNKIAWSGLPTNNDFRYKGFWNIRDDRYLIDAETDNSRTAIGRQQLPKDMRDSLGHDDSALGKPTSPIEYSDERLQVEQHYRREYQPQLSFDHYMQ